MCNIASFSKAITLETLILFPLSIDWRNYSEKQTISSSTGHSMIFMELSLQQSNINNNGSDTAYSGQNTAITVLLGTLA